RARAPGVRSAPGPPLCRARYADAIRGVARTADLCQTDRVFDGLPAGRSQLGQHVHLGRAEAVTQMVVGITGASGFIGSALVERHLASGDEVRILTRSQRGDASPRITQIRGDLTNADESLARFADGLD